MKQTIIQFQYK